MRAVVTKSYDSTECESSTVGSDQQRMWIKEFTSSQARLVQISTECESRSSHHRKHGWFRSSHAYFDQRCPRLLNDVSYLRDQFSSHTFYKRSRTRSEQTENNGIRNSREIPYHSGRLLLWHIHQQNCLKSWYGTNISIQLTLYGGIEDK